MENILRYLENINAIIPKIEYNHSSEVGMEDYITC